MMMGAQVICQWFLEKEPCEGKKRNLGIKKQLFVEKSVMRSNVICFWACSFRQFRHEMSRLVK
jgi:hypothetical protein